jgi:Glycosyl hydrolase family 79 C-terminal beta domain
MNRLQISVRAARCLLFALAVLAVAGAISSCGSSGGGSSALTVQRATVGRPIPNGFAGLSMEFRGLEAYVGKDPAALDPAFVQLLRNLAPGQSPVLRIGGDSTDWTWWPVAGMTRPPGVKYDLDQNWLNVGRALSRAIGGRLILGVNLEAGSPPVAAAEARAFLDGIGHAGIDALEVGNEPEPYGSFSWYRTPAGVHVLGRPRGYDFQDYLRDFSSFVSSLPPATVAGPSAGGPEFIRPLDSFLSGEPGVGLVTIHSYPLKHCSKSSHVTIDQLLSDESTAGLARTIAPSVRIAARHGLGLRIDEMNAVSCGGARGVSDAFGSALWALDALFELAQAGVQGVNIDTVPGTINELIGAHQAGASWHAEVHPEYYGLMMFAQATPVGSRLLRLSWRPPAGIRAWATRALDGHVRLVLINRQSGAQTVHVRIPSMHGPATLERLEAPSVQATSGVTLGGQSFGSDTTTGVLAGPRRHLTVAPVSGRYTVTLSGYSAAMLTL